VGFIPGKSVFEPEKMSDTIRNLGKSITIHGIHYDFSMSAINISQNFDSYHDRKTNFLPFFQYLCELSFCISHSPDRFPSRRGSETGIPDFPRSKLPVKLPHASLAITLNTPSLHPKCASASSPRMQSLRRTTFGLKRSMDARFKVIASDAWESLTGGIE
jgi:hypothetical protein